MNLKNNYLLKKLLKCANKTCKNFKRPRDIIILHLCTKNLDNMTYRS